MYGKYSMHEGACKEINTGSVVQVHTSTCRQCFKWQLIAIVAIYS